MPYGEHAATRQEEAAKDLRKAAQAPIKSPTGGLALLQACLPPDQGCAGCCCQLTVDGLALQHTLCDLVVEACEVQLSTGEVTSHLAQVLDLHDVVAEDTCSLSSTPAGKLEYIALLTQTNYV